MSKISHIDVEVRPSIGFQTVGITARIAFDAPVDHDEAVKEANTLFERLNLESQAALEVLIGQRRESEGNTTASPVTISQPVISPAPSGGLTWATANKPNGHGQFRYVTTTSISSDEFRDRIREQIPALGISLDDVDIFDDRVGNYGLESGNESYSAGKIKVKDGTKLKSAMNGKAIVGSADFGSNGEVKVVLSKDGKAALQALTIAANIAAI
jgi:hypothetical protein